MKTATQIRKGLKRYNAVTQTHKHKSGFRITSKVKYLAEAAECQWLIDFIGKYQPAFRRYPIQYWKVQIVEDSAIVTLTDTHGIPIFWKTLPANSFPLWEGLELRVCCDILYLPRKRRMGVGKLSIYSLEKIAESAA